MVLRRRPVARRPLRTPPGRAAPRRRRRFAGSSEAAARCRRRTPAGGPGSDVPLGRDAVCQLAVKGPTRGRPAPGTARRRSLSAGFGGQDLSAAGGRRPAADRRLARGRPVAIRVARDGRMATFSRHAGSAGPIAPASASGSGRPAGSRAPAACGYRHAPAGRAGTRAPPRGGDRRGCYQVALGCHTRSMAFRSAVVTNGLVRYWAPRARPCSMSRGWTRALRKIAGIVS